MPPAALKAVSHERLVRRKTDMAQYASIIEMISLPPSQRPDDRVDVTALWLQRKSQLLQEVELQVIRDVARNCAYLCVDEGQPIVRQGEVGDAFYVILEGRVSVYVRDDDEEDDGIDGGDSEKGSADDGGSEGSEGGERDGATATKASSQRSKIVKQQAGQPPSQPALSPAAAPATPSAAVPGGGGEAEQAPAPQAPPGRFRYGNKVASFGTGGSFGELALISDDNVRTASVVTDVKTDLLVVHRELYNRSIKAYQERDLREARQFVERHRFFRGWPPKPLHQVVVSVRRVKLAAGECVVRQGDAVDGLHFLRGGGKAVVSFQPRRHRDQYGSSVDLSRYEAEAAAVAAAAKDSETPSPLASLQFAAGGSGSGAGGGGLVASSGAAGSTGSLADAVSRHKLRRLTAEYVQERRLEGYAAAERKYLRRHQDLCLVSDGEVIGDVEHALGLPTYMMTVRAVDEASLYHLDGASVERLLGARRHAGQTHVEHANRDVRDSAMLKWSLRGDLYRSVAAEIPFLRYVTDSLRRPETRGGARGGSGRAHTAALRRRGRELPKGDTLFRHLLDAYAVDRAELVQPYVPGAVYYKELMKDRARQRQATRKLDHAAAAPAPGGGVASEYLADVGGGPVLLPSTLRKRMDVRKPRSISVLKSVIKAMQTSDVDAIIPKRPVPSLSFFLPTPPDVPTASAALNDAFDQQPAPTVGAAAPEGVTARDAGGEGTAASVQAPATAAFGSEVPSENGPTVKPPPPEAAAAVENVDAAEAAAATDVALTQAAGRRGADAAVGGASPRGGAMMYTVIREELQEEQATAAAAVGPEQAIAAVAATNRSVTRGGGRSEDVELAEGQVLKFFSPYLRGKLSKVYEDFENPEIRRCNRETSLLEKRMLRFYDSSLKDSVGRRTTEPGGSGSSGVGASEFTSGDGGGDGGGSGGDSEAGSAPAAAGLLTRLNRLEAVNVVVKPGGKCVVKRSVCRLLNCEFQFKSHKHTRYHITNGVGVPPQNAAARCDCTAAGEQLK